MAFQRKQLLSFIGQCLKLLVRIPRTLHFTPDDHGVQAADPRPYLGQLAVSIEDLGEKHFLALGH